MASPTLLRSLHRHLRRRQAAMVDLLGALVLLESPTTEKAAVTRLARFLARLWRQRSARVQVLHPRNAGAILRADVFLGRGRPQRQLLVLGHLDTVYPRGTLRRMPFRVRGGRAGGPGTVDMKSGLVQALFAVEALEALRLQPARRLVFLFTSDEETGSAAGRPMVEREARRSRAVLVLEPASGLGGALKTARKGVGEFELVVEGRAAHAGIEPEKGVNAIEELAAQLLRVKRFARPRQGLTLIAGVIEGGTRTNVVPDRARALVDVRIARRAQGPWIERGVGALGPVNRRPRLGVAGGINRPPLERTREVAQHFRLAQQLARALGGRLEEASTGGASHRNFTPDNR